MTGMDTLPLTPDELLTTTRSVRRRLDLDRPVDLAVVRECVEIALQAPSGGNAQRWHWIVVTDPALREPIGGYYRRAWQAYSKDSAPGAVRDSAAHLADVLAQVPVLLIPCLEVPTLPAGSQASTWGSLLPAAWSYMLAARARGLGTAWTTLHLRYEREVAELLGLPDGIRQGALIPTAYYTGETFKPARRTPVEEVLHVDGWGG
ncbi:MAG TPA: nitroreductase family protein [Mycobacteriales bacterium]|nr:nitroreductase family protein [Mycobacteriales bacterium]